MAKSLKGLVAESQVALSFGRGLDAVRNFTVARKEIDHIEAERGRAFENRVKWRVQRESAISEPPAGDLNRRELGEKAAARQDVVHVDPVRRGVEEHGVAAFDVGGTKGNPRISVVETAEIDQLPEAFARWTEVVKAAEARDRNRQAGMKEAGMAEQAGIDRAQPGAGWRLTSGAADALPDPRQ